MMTPTQVMTSPLRHMDLAELCYVYAYCDGEIRRCAEHSTTMDRFEKRRQEAETELWSRR